MELIFPSPPYTNGKHQTVVELTMARRSSHDTQALKRRIHQAVCKSADGVKESELEDILNIQRRTINNYLRELETEGKIYKDGLYWVPDTTLPLILRDLPLEPEEAMVLYLAIRLFVKQTDRRNISAENVLGRLGEILSSDAGLGQDIAYAVHQLTQRPFHDGYEDVFRTIMRGYLYRRSVRIVYQPYRGNAFETVIQPYLLEPSAIGYSTYVVCHSSIVDDLRTYKIERIQTASLVHNVEYQIPDEFPGLDILQNAWSIFYGHDVIQVTLRFHPDVARRVQETHWHPSQQPIEDDLEKAGYVLMRIEVADTTDLKPWIRTWGANCEVLEPKELRDELRGEARRFAELYGWDFGSQRKKYDGIFGD